MPWRKIIPSCRRMLEEEGNIIIALLIILFSIWHIKACIVNSKTLKKKEVENSSQILRIWYLIGGPWTTYLIINKKNKILNNDEEIVDFYINHLRHQKSLVKIIQTLDEKKLKPDERKKLRGHVVIDETLKKDFYNIISVLVTLIVAAFVAFSVAGVQVENIANIEKVTIAGGSAIFLILVYSLILAFLSARKNKVTKIKVGLDVYEELSNTKKNEDQLN